MHLGHTSKPYCPLPDKPSELIRLALDDLKKCERSKKYVVDMDIWHTYNPDTCYVCLAGSVMAKSLGERNTHTCEPADYHRVIQGKLYALNYFREGVVMAGLAVMGIYPEEMLAVADIPDYGRNRSGFHAAMRKLARDLAKLGY